MKAGVRILAIAAAPLKKRDTLLVGIVSRADMIEGILTTRVTVDGTDSTERIAKMLNSSRFNEQVRVIATNGIGLAGLNIIDVQKLEKQTGTKAISVTRRKPHPKELVKALRLYSKQKGQDVKQRIKLVDSVTKMNEYKAEGFYVQTGMTKADALLFLANASKLLRLAHLLASGISSGESKGRL